MDTLKLMLIGLLLLCSYNINSQNNQTKKVWYGIDYSYGLGIQDRGDLFSLNRSNSNGNMHVVDLRAMAGYNISEQFSLGAGLGLAGYHNNSFNTMPIFLDVRYNLPVQHRKFFVYTDVAFPLSVNSDVNSLFMDDFGIGYKIPCYKRIKFVPSVGYNFITYKTAWGTITERRYRHSLYVRLGIEF
jgi:hypothetical protein